MMASRSLANPAFAVARRHGARRIGASCSSSVAATAMRMPAQQRNIHSSPSSQIMDSLRGFYNNIKDRGLSAVGRETSQDVKMRETLSKMDPKAAKSLLRLQRKRWGAPQTFVDPQTGDVTQRITEHKYSTAKFRISPRKLQLLADQIGGGKPVDYSILQMQFSHKRAARRIKSTLALARDHAIAKGLDPSKLVVSEAWVGKGLTHKRLEIKGRGRTGIQTRFEARMFVVLREGKSYEENLAKRMEKEKRIVRSVGTGGVVRVNRPIINTHQRPGWQW